jgi:F420-dependent oxidoreductase-like protein
MRFGIWPSPAWSWEETLELASHCERTGWDGVYFADHFMPNAEAPEDGDTIECWSVLAALAASVPRVRLAPLVTSVTYRHPAVLANIAAATDRISGGRLTLGIGAGWQLNEHAAYGLALGPVKERLDRFEEACEILVSLLREARTNFSGGYYEVKDAPNQPAPVQPRLPLLIGGKGEKRMLGIVARFADEWNCWSTPDVLAHKSGVLKRFCDEEGRDFDQIHVSTQAMVWLSDDSDRVKSWREKLPAEGSVIGSPEEVATTMAEFRDAGADEFILPAFNLGDRSRRLETCDMFIEQVAADLR